MAIQVTQVSPPAPGVDWAFTVPGQWLPYLYGVVATLGTTSHVVSFADETGNGNPALLLPGPKQYVIGAPGPYAGGANNYAVSHPDFETGTNDPIARTAQMSMVTPAAFTLEAWALLLPTTAVGVDLMGLVSVPASGCFTAISTPNNNNAPYGVRLNANGLGGAIINNVAARSAWHLIAITWDGTNWNVYADGVNKGTTTFGAYTATGVLFRTDVGGDLFNGVMRGSVGACALYPAALGAGSLAAHAAANATWATYKAAVLADGPLGLWGLNTIPTLANRMATLQVTDGTNVVAQFPANFAAATASGFIWSWQALGSGAAASTDGITNSVPIPEIRVDSGYTIGVKTLDLQPTDQWGPITVWFDDGTGPGGAGPGGAGGVDYLDARFVPDMPNG